jgi:hypothetical protein
VSDARRGSWSVLELARLRELYPRSRLDTIARLLRRSPESVRRRAVHLFRRPPRRGPWTPDEDGTLRIGWGAVELRDLAIVLARPQRDVRQRAEELRARRSIGPWRPDEERALRRWYGARSDRDLEVCLSRPAHEITAMAARLCLRKDKRVAGEVGAREAMPRWSPVDVARLVTLYPDHENVVVARLLARSVASVANKASQLRLRKRDELREQLGRRRYRL